MSCIGSRPLSAGAERGEESSASERPTRPRVALSADARHVCAHIDNALTDSRFLSCEREEAADERVRGGGQDVSLTGLQRVDEIVHDPGISAAMTTLWQRRMHGFDVAGAMVVQLELFARLVAK